MQVDSFLSGFVSRENKGAVILIPKPKVASASLVARSISLDRQSPIPSPKKGA